MRARHLCFAQAAVVALLFSTYFAFEAWAAERIRLRPGFTTLLKFNRPIGTVVVGNPEVVDATVQGNQAIVLTAKKIAGITNVLVLDQELAELSNITVSVGAAASGKVEIHSRRLLHEYWAYACTPVCERVKDELEALPRVAPSAATTVTQITTPPGEAPPQPQQAPPQ